MVRVVFLHPDLGIGGAERLIVDCSLALQSKGHETLILTSHHDPSHCFRETVTGQCAVAARADWLPRTILGRCHALCASLRMLYLALYLAINLPAEVVVVDQVSTPLLLLRLLGFPTIFYCHYPDLLLSPKGNLLKRLYRAPLNWLEQATTGLADIVLVNSNFTRGVFRATFPSLTSVEPAVLYPSLATAIFQEAGVRPAELRQDQRTDFLSLNRFERKKDIGLAIRALALVPGGSARLVVAGGYDSRVRENVEHLEELRGLAEELGLAHRVAFLTSPSDSEKVWLLKNASCLLYTPANEHFGIVPLEAMHCGTPVLAVASGGPLETVEHGVTGWLVEGEPRAWAAVMEGVLAGGADRLAAMGEAGRARVAKYFSFPAFAQHLEDYVTISVAGRPPPTPFSFGKLLGRLALAFHFSMAIILLFWMVFWTPLP